MVKFLVVLRDRRGRDSVALVKAANAQEASQIAANKWPKHTVSHVKNMINV